MCEFRYEKDNDKIVTVSLELSGESTEGYPRTFANSLEALITRLEKDDFAGVIIASESGVFAGAEHARQLHSFPGSERAEVFACLSQIKSGLRRLETLGKPVVASISGMATAVEYEICLAAHHRIALNDSALRIGLPEANCGLFPGLGGVVRTVYMLGLEKALPLLQSGAELDPEKALAAGLVDALTSNREELLTKAKTWIKEHPEVHQPWDIKGFQLPGGSPTHPRVSQMIMVAPAILRKQKPANAPAQESILTVAVEAAQVDLDTALRIESRYLVDFLFYA